MFNYSPLPFPFNLIELGYTVTPGHPNPQEPPTYPCITFSNTWQLAIPFYTGWYHTEITAHDIIDDFYNTADLLPTWKLATTWTPSFMLDTTTSYLSTNTSTISTITTHTTTYPAKHCFL